MLGTDQSDDTGDMRSRKAVSCGDTRAAIQPRNFDINTKRSEFNRRGRVVIIRHRLMTVMCGNRYDGGIKRRVAGHRDIINRRHQHDIIKVCLIS